jgi:hypothetical protein
MSVALDAIMTAGNGTGGAFQKVTTASTSISSTGMTVGAGASMVLALLSLGDQGFAPSGAACTWDSVSMTLLASINNTAGNDSWAGIFMLLSPTSGNQTLAASWTSNAQANLSAISFTGTDIVTGYESADNVTGTSTGGTAVSFGINTDARGATVGLLTCNISGSLTIATQTTIFNATGVNINAGASYGLGGSGSTTHTFDYTSSTTNAWVGIHILAAGSPGLLAVTNQGGF